MGLVLHGASYGFGDRGSRRVPKGNQTAISKSEVVITLSIGVYGRIESWVVDVDLMGTDTDNRPIRLV